MEKGVAEIKSGKESEKVEKSGGKVEEEMKSEKRVQKRRET